MREIKLTRSKTFLFQHTISLSFKGFLVLVEKKIIFSNWEKKVGITQSSPKHRSLEYIDWARAEFTCSDLSCLDERLGDFEKFPLPWLGEAHSTSQLGNQANRARSPRLSSWAACRLIYVFPLSLVRTVSQHTKYIILCKLCSFSHMNQLTSSLQTSCQLTKYRHPYIYLSHQKDTFYLAFI